MSIESVMPSNHLILCHPLLLPTSIFPSIRVFSNESAILIMWPKYWSFSFDISPSNEYSGLISFKMDWLDLLAVREALESVTNDTQTRDTGSRVLSSRRWACWSLVLLTGWFSWPGLYVGHQWVLGGSALGGRLAFGWGGRVTGAGVELGLKDAAGKGRGGVLLSPALSGCHEHFHQRT